MADYRHTRFVAVEVFDTAYSLYGFGVEYIAPESIDRIGGVDDYSASTQ